jgi:hypothetical protein
MLNIQLLINNHLIKRHKSIKKEILSIVLCITKFQSDLLNQTFLLRIDCKSAKYILKKDVENIASKQVFARWQAILRFFFILILNISNELTISFQIFLLVNFRSALMASKKDKGKSKVRNPANALVNKSESTPIDSHVTITNRFMAFSLEPSISYSSTLISSYDPFVVSSQKPRTPFVKHEQASTYVRVPYFQHLFFVEINCASIRDHSQLALTYFPYRFH